MNVFLWIVLGAFSAAVASAFFLTFAGGRLRILDHPNARSLHNTPTPRTGGLAIWAGGFIGITFIVMQIESPRELSWLISAALVVGVISFIDDRSHVPVRIRFTAHLLASALLLSGGLALSTFSWPGGGIDLSASMGSILSLFFVVWMINLYNFMDGMDGFAGGMAVIGFGTFGVLGSLGGDAGFAAISWIIAAAAAGFLIWNFPPARIFMGDTGSSTLGLMAAGLALWADRRELFPLWISILVFSPFIVDATVTLVRRLVRGETVWEAHRSHYYQRLVQAGWGHRRTVLWEYGLMLLCGIAAVVALKASVAVQWLIVSGVGLLYIIAMLGVHRLEIRTAGLRE